MTEQPDTDDLPTATEFIPADEVPGPNRKGDPMVRGHRLKPDGSGVEMVYHGPHQDSVEERAYVCDECGDVSDTESEITDHLRDKHHDSE